METLTGLPSTVLIAAVAIYILAGLVKGTIGIGLPTAGISLTAQITDARTAIALVIIPMLLTNVWQVWRSRTNIDRAIQYWPLAITMAVGIVAFSVVAPKISIGLVTLMLGVTVLVFSIVSLAREIPALPSKFETPAQLIAGVTAGAMGSVGLITRGQAIASAMLVIPSIIGFSIGERIRERLDEALFKRLVLWFFLLMGLNLIRKSLQASLF